MHLVIGWYVYLLGFILVGLIGVWIFTLPPKIKPLTAHELSSIGEYHRRLSRKGVFNHPDMIIVTEIGKAQEQEAVSCI